MPAGWAAAAAAVVGAVVSSDASRKASHTQADAANAVAGNQADMFNITNSQQAPWRQAGQNALSQLMPGGGVDANGNPLPGSSLGSQFSHQFDANDLKTNLAPNYQFMLDQGLSANKNAANLQTGLLSGNALKANEEYAQNYAGNAYQNAFNNYNVGQSNIFNRLASIAQLGQTSVGQTGQSALGFGSNIGSAQLAGAASQAAGTIGQSKAISGGLSSLASIYSANNNTNTMTSSQVPTTYDYTSGANAYPAGGGTTNDASFYM